MVHTPIGFVNVAESPSIIQNDDFTAQSLPGSYTRLTSKVKVDRVEHDEPVTEAQVHCGAAPVAGQQLDVSVRHHAGVRGVRGGGRQAAGDSLEEPEARRRQLARRDR